MNVPSKVQMDLIERAARAAFPDFECLDVRGGEVFVCKIDGGSERFNPLFSLDDALSLAEKLDIEFAGGRGKAEAIVRIGKMRSISVSVTASNVNPVWAECPLLCLVITYCAATVHIETDPQSLPFGDGMGVEKCKQSQ